MWITRRARSPPSAARQRSCLAETTVAGGTVDARHFGVVDLDHATIIGSTLATDCGGTIEVVAMRGDDTNMSVFDGSSHAVTIDGYVLVDPGANLELIGTIHNEGMVEVDGKQTDLVIDGHVTLDGHGTVMLDNASHPADEIVGGDGDGNTLDNVNNTIEGAGNIGTGNGDLSLVNEKNGTIDANACDQTLTLDTGRNRITNAGTLAASHGGALDVESSVNNADGSIKVSDGGFADFEKSVTGGTARFTAERWNLTPRRTSTLRSTMAWVRIAARSFSRTGRRSAEPATCSA